MEASYFTTENGIVVRVDENTPVDPSMAQLAPKAPEPEIHDAKAATLTNAAARRRVCKGCKEHLVEQAQEKFETKQQLRRSGSGAFSCSGSSGKSSSESCDSQIVNDNNGENSANGSVRPRVSSKNELNEENTCVSRVTEEIRTPLLPSGSHHQKKSLQVDVQASVTPVTFERIWDEDLSSKCTSMSDMMTSPLVRSTMKMALEGHLDPVSASSGSPRNRSTFTEMSSILFGVPVLECDEEDEDEDDDENAEFDPLSPSVVTPLSDQHQDGYFVRIHAREASSGHVADEPQFQEGLEFYSEGYENKCADAAVGSTVNEDDVATPVRMRKSSNFASDCVNEDDVVTPVRVSGGGGTGSWNEDDIATPVRTHGSSTGCVNEDDIDTPVRLNSAALRESVNEDGVATPVRMRVTRPLAAEINKENSLPDTLTGTGDSVTRPIVFSVKAPKLVVSGAPGAGKTTQCEALRQELGVVHLSVGEILRQAISDTSELELQASNYVENWKLSDEFVTKVVCDRLKQPDCVANGWLLDDFPRTKIQAAALSFAGVTPDCFIMLDVAEDSLVDRVKGRRIDPVTGHIYHDKFNPPKSKIVASRLTQRCDDAEIVFAKRYCDFMTHKDGLHSWYSERALTVDASAAPFSVSHQILSALDGDFFSQKPNVDGDDTKSIPSPISPSLFPALQDLYVPSSEKKDTPNSAVAQTPNPMLSRTRAPPVSFISTPYTDTDGDGDRSSLFTYSPDMSIGSMASERRVDLSPLMTDSPGACQSPRSAYSSSSVKSYKSSEAVRARIAALTEQQTFSVSRLVGSWYVYISQYPLMTVVLKTIILSLLLHAAYQLVQPRALQQQRGRTDERYSASSKPSFMQYALLSYSGDAGSADPTTPLQTVSTTWGTEGQDSVTRTYFVAITARKCYSSTSGNSNTPTVRHKNVYVRMVQDHVDNLYSSFTHLLVEMNENAHQHNDYF